MELLDIRFWVQLVVYAVSFGVCYGRIATQINNLEKKVEKHNNLVERTIALEHGLKTAHHRIDELKGDKAS